MPNLPPNKRLAWQPEKEAGYANKKETDPFYTSAPWRKLRLWYLQQHPLCAHCLIKGKTTVANIVDHIVRIQDGGEKLNQNNLQSLCTSCHNSKSAKESHEKRDR